MTEPDEHAVQSTSGETVARWNDRGLAPQQHDMLLRPIRRTRIANRRVSGKNLSYLEAWDVKAHLIRVFGFGNFDSETIDEEFLGTREYQSDQDKPMVEVIWRVRHRLVVRDHLGHELARYTEGAVGSASGPANMLGDMHDNALKTAASDALKRCAINLGTQFGLSLYSNGTTEDVVKGTLVYPGGVRSMTDATAGPSEEDRQKPAAELVARIGALPEEQRKVLTGKFNTAGFPKAVALSPEQVAVVNGWIDGLENEAATQTAKDRLGAAVADPAQGA